MTKNSFVPFLSALNLKMCLRSGFIALALVSCLGTASADTVTLLASDAAGTTSFTGSTNWSNLQPPGAANDYFVPKSLGNPNVDYIIRTPTSGAVTFAGNSLTVEGYVAFKGMGLVTVNDLRLTNGLVGNYNAGGSTSTGHLAGNLNIITNGVIYAGGGLLNMQILSTISGSGGLEIRQPSVVTLSATNTYNGPVILTGSTLELDGTGSLTPSSLTLEPYINGGSSVATVTNIVRAGGNLNVGYGSSGVLRVGYRANSTTNCVATLDVSAQPQFNVNVGEFSVGININSGGSGTSLGNVYLATNNTVTATNILIADAAGASGGTSTMLLGGGSNYFNTPLLTAGRNKEGSQMTLPAGGVFRLDNGAGRTELTVGGEVVNTSSNPSDTMDLSGGAFIGSLDALTIGLKSSGGSGSTTGALILGSSAANNVNVNSVVVGNLAGAASGAGTTRGTLTFGGGSFLVNGDVTLASYDNNGNGAVSGTLNVNGGDFSVAGNIVDGGGASALNLNAGVIDMQPSGDGTPGSVTVDVLSGSGTITNASAVAVSTVVNPGGSNTVGTLTVSSLDVSSGAAMNFDLIGSLTIGGGVNDLLEVNGNLVLNNNTVTVKALSPLATGTYRLVNYTGSLSGSTSLILNAPATRQTFNLDLSVPGQINLVVSGNPIDLTWSGDGSGNVWDAGTTANWNGNSDVFYGGDFVTFDDSGSAVPDINVTTPVQPGSMTVNNTTEAYVFDGSPISTPGNLIKQGNNVLAFANDGNDFSGPISIEAGTLSIGNGGSSGSLGNGSITNNGELLLNKSSSGAALNGTISGSGSIRLTGGGGTLSLGGTNSYTGLTTVENGSQLNILNNSALGSTNTGTVVQSGGSARFTSAGNWTVAEPLEINGYGISGTPGALYANTTSNNVTWAGPITVGSPAQIRVVNTGVRMTLTGPVTANQQALEASANDSSCLLTFQNTLSLGDAATLTTDGSGMVALAGVTNFCGGTIINGGTLEIVTTNSPQIGDITVNSGALQIGSGAADGSLPTGQINLAGSGTKLTINSSDTFVLNHPLIGSGGLSLLNFGTLIITNANTFSGNVTTGNGTPTYGGIIRLTDSQGLGTDSKTITLTHASLQLQGGLDIPSAISFLTSGGTLSVDITNNLIPIHSLSGNNIIEGNIQLNTGAGDTVIAADSGSTLTLNGLITGGTGRTLYLSGDGDGVIAGYMYDGDGVPNLTKQGSGIWTLNGEQDYSGKTTIQGGTLKLNSGYGTGIPNTTVIQLSSNAVFDASAIGGFTLGSSQTLSGNGNIAGDFAASGTVSPGPLGTLNFSNNLTLSGSTIMELNRDGIQNADLIAAANLTFGGTLTVTNIGASLQAGDTFHLFDGSFSGSFSATNLPALSSTNLFWDISQFGSAGILIVGSYTAPTPTILPPSLNGDNLEFQVASQSGYDYVLEATPQLAPANWTDIQTNAGGGTLTFTIPVNSTNLQQFFRVRVQ